MKRIFILFSVLTMAIVAIAKDNPQRIILSTDNGQGVKELRFFQPDQISDVINEAMPQDTIYFTSGRFYLGNMEYLNEGDSYNKMLTKPLTFIGAGADGDDATAITFQGWGHLWLNIDDNVEGGRNVSFEGMVIEMPIRIKNNVDKLTFRNAFINAGFYGNINESDGTINQVIIDRCYGNDLRGLNGHVTNLSINNSKIDFIEGDYSDSELDHCYISYIYPFKGTIKNSTVEYVYDSPDTKFRSCVFFSKDSSADYDDNCVTTEGRGALYIDESPAEYGFSDCGDSTPIGTSGGDTPFTLNPSYPTPDSSGGVGDMIYLSIPAKDKINIKVTLKGNK